MNSEKKIRAVIDTNIWISALLNLYGFPAKIRNAFRDGLFCTVVSEPVLKEIADVLYRPRIKQKYKIADADIQELLILIEERSEHVLLTGDISVCRDKNDDMIIETSIRGKADYLVTRDDDMKTDRKVSSFLLEYGVSVVSVVKFLSLICQSVPGEF